MSAENKVEAAPKSQVISASVPVAVANAIRDQAAANDRTVSWVICRICMEWHSRLPGAKVDLSLVSEPEDRGGVR